MLEESVSKEAMRNSVVFISVAVNVNGYKNLVLEGAICHRKLMAMSKNCQIAKLGGI